MMDRYFFIIIFKIFICFCFSQTTGKIDGNVIDFETLEPLIGVNIILVNTDLGTSTDTNGDFYLINIPSGKYSLSVSMIGYKNLIIENIDVSVNRTTPLKIVLETSVLEGDLVVVKSDQVSIKKDQTSSVKNISSEQIDIMTVENRGQIIGMQAGIVAGHFRGGRNTEVTYLVDGIKVDEVYGGTSSITELETGSVSELEVITGTFNAEYGKAMSGVVNQVTKSGSNKFNSSIQFGYANFATFHSNIFPGINNLSDNRNLDYRLLLSGPIIKDRIHYFINYRLEDNYNHLNGIHYLNPNDYSNYLSDSSSSWLSEHTGEHVFETYCMDNKGIPVLN